MKIFHVFCLAAATLTLASLPACQTPQAPAQVAQNLNGIRTEMASGRENVVWMGKSLSSLRASNGSDLNLLFANYTRNLEGLETKAGGVKVVVETQQDLADKYFQNWEKEIDALASEDLRRRGGDRRDVVLEAYNDVKASIVTLRKSFQPYHASLRDTQRFLAADLTPAGLKQAKPSIERSMELQSKVLADLDAVIVGIDRLSRN